MVNPSLVRKSLNEIAPDPPYLVRIVPMANVAVADARVICTFMSFIEMAPDEGVGIDYPCSCFNLIYLIIYIRTLMCQDI
jgi:hypothetical protein